MNEVSRRASQVSTTARLAQGVDPGALEFDEVTRPWSSVDDLPRRLIVQMHVESLFPGAIYLEYVDSVRAHVPRGGMPARDVVEGWLIGETGLTTFTISRPLGAVGDAAWQLVCRCRRFAGRPDVLARTFAAETAGQRPADPACDDGVSLGLADVLPASVRRKLLATPQPWDGQSVVTRHLEPWRAGFTVSVLQTAPNQVIGVVATRIVPRFGPAEDAEARLAVAPWEVRLVRGRFA